MKLNPEVIMALDNCEIKGNKVTMPPMPRGLYNKVNDALENMGGKWVRKEKAHVFEDDPNEIFEMVINTGEVADLKKDFNFFATPDLLAKRLVDLAEINENHLVLEPSAGKGNILKHFPNHSNSTAIELNIDNFTSLKENFPTVNMVCCDFTALFPNEEELYDRVVMNPPFKQQRDLQHVMHAMTFLKEGGILVAVVSESAFFRTNILTVSFRRFLEDYNAEIIDLEQGAFKESGTNVKTRIIKLSK
jgi:16S rRNA G966 N2-methylase RsmD